MRREIQEMLCAHEAFRRLGFEASDIFTTVGLDPKYGVGPQVFVFVTVGVGFNLRICPLWCDETTLHENWLAAVALWNEPARLLECTAIWEASELCARFEDLAAAMRRKGLRLPALDEAMAERAKLN
jgi:hypothetical protein